VGPAGSSVASGPGVGVGVNSGLGLASPAISSDVAVDALAPVADEGTAGGEGCKPSRCGRSTGVTKMSPIASRASMATGTAMESAQIPTLSGTIAMMNSANARRLRGRGEALAVNLDPLAPCWAASADAAGTNASPAGRAPRDRGSGWLGIGERLCGRPRLYCLRLREYIRHGRVPTFERSFGYMVQYFDAQRWRAVINPDYGRQRVYDAKSLMN
jgi:hypothetical protein